MVALPAGPGAPRGVAGDGAEAVPALLRPVRGGAVLEEGAVVDGRGWLAAAAHRDLVLAMAAAAATLGHDGLQRPLDPDEAVVAWVERERAAAAGTAREADLETVLVLGGWRSALRRRRGGGLPVPAHVVVRVPGRPALRWLAEHRPGPLLDFTASRSEGARSADRGAGTAPDVVDDVVVAFQGTWPAEHGTAEHRAAAGVHREYLRRAAEVGLDRPVRPLEDARAEAHRWSAGTDEGAGEGAGEGADRGGAPARWHDLGAYVHGRGAGEVMSTARALAYRRAGVGAEEALALEAGGRPPGDEELRVLRALRG
ncbi:hypothetical protein [Kineococcus indalonis]|uniref:hypothetical protein n=1 Tax=Kineococcus indalonis TaxID=2696566 RepID=UPI001411F4CC|nr:hypothetical protein [Kineococcus indalonis]NAZ86472.1 hypothetical protein [Kineococcus indalonis]